MGRVLTNQATTELGAWLPWPIVEAVLKLELRPASRWRVFLAILCNWCRYGRKEAWLKVRQIADQTGLSERTVKAALKDLYAVGIVIRISRGKLAVDVTRLATRPMKHDSAGQPDGAESLGASLLAHPEGKEVLTLTNSSISTSEVKKERKGGLSRRQLGAIQATLTEATGLLGLEAIRLTLSLEICEAIGLGPNTTIGDAIAQLKDNCDSRTAHKLTGAILALRSDERIGGQELIITRTDAAGVENVINRQTT